MASLVAAGAKTAFRRKPTEERIGKTILKTVSCQRQRKVNAKRMGGVKMTAANSSLAKSNVGAILKRKGEKNKQAWDKRCRGEDGQI